VKLFRSGQGLPSRAKFQEAHFVKQLGTILWKNESVLLSEFVKEGNDVPQKDPRFTSTQKQESTKSFAGHPFHYLAITEWRILLGYPGSGLVASFAFAKNEVTIFSDGDGKIVCIATKYDKRTDYDTYIISENMSKILEANCSNPIPTPAEQTQFLEYPEEWGQGAEHDGQRLIAQIAKKQSGSDYAIVKQCEVCGQRVSSPEMYPRGYFDYCHKCLRKST
jgi:hypothetical protein